MTTITAANGAGTTTPTTVLGYEASVESQNAIHQIIGGGIAVSLARANPRKGTLILRYSDPDAAAACLTLHSEATTFTLAGTLAAANVTYIVHGSVSLEVDADLGVVDVTVSYQEVLP